MNEPLPAPGESTQPGACRRTSPDPRLPGESECWGWVALLAGLALYTLVQGLLVCIPLWTRALPPEVDDSLAYLVRTRQMEECFFQDCPALLDLKEQRQIGLDDPAVVRAHDLSAFPFPIYHPLFSALILGVKTLTGDLITAYKVLWSLSPLFFGTAFACLLTALWGKAAAGVTLALLAFKIFPDTGLRYLTPSNLAMGVAVLMWARIIARRGDATWTLVLGSVVLVSSHPIGFVHVLASSGIALLAAEDTTRRKVRASTLAVWLLLAIAGVFASLIREPQLINVTSMLGSSFHPAGLASALASNLQGIVVGLSRLKDNLFGEPALLLLAVATGFLLAPAEQRRILKRILLVLCAVVFISLFHSHVVSPAGDLFFRLWIPPAVIMAGAVGHAMARFAVEALEAMRKSHSPASGTARALVERTWPALFFLMLAGYAVGVAVTGGEHLVATAEHMRNRQDLSFSRDQVETLLKEAGPNDRVLYTGAMPMAFFFAQGTMGHGAVYYHPAYAGTAIEAQWLTRPDLRFAVAYNPLVHHPLLEDLDEKDQCISSPEYRFSPLSKPRRHGHILKEGFIHGDELRWMAVHPGTEEAPGSLRLFVRNPGASQVLVLKPLEQFESSATGPPMTISVPAAWNGWLEQDLPDQLAGRPIQVTLPGGARGLSIGGITFGPSHLHWPWEHKARVTLKARDPATGLVVVSFDPRSLLPQNLRTRKAVVIHDAGSSVLLEVGR